MRGRQSELPSVMALRTCLVLMRDASRDPELRLSAAHVAIVLQHLGDQELHDIDARALQAAVRETEHG